MCTQLPDIDLSHAIRSDACVLFTGDHETAEAARPPPPWAERLAAGAIRRRRLRSAGSVAGVSPVRLCSMSRGQRRRRPLADAGAIRHRVPAGRRTSAAGRCSCGCRSGWRFSGPAPGNHAGTRRRVISSSSTPLAERLEDGTFDANLYYRLNVIHFVIAPGEQG